MTSETDEQFVDRMRGYLLANIEPDDAGRVLALARRGAAVQWKPCCVCGAMQHWMPLPPPPAGETSDE